MHKATFKKILAVVTVMSVLSLVFAGCMPAASGDAGAGSMIQMLLPIGLLVVVFYFFMIRPEKKRKKAAEELRSSLAVGDPVVTIGGMVGKIVGVSEENIVFETSEDRVRIEVKKWAISKNSKT